MATYLGILAWETNGQRSLGDYSLWVTRVGHNLATKQHVICVTLSRLLNLSVVSFSVFW